MIRFLLIVFKAGPHVLFEYFKWIRKYSKHPERYPFSLRFYRVQALCKYVMNFFNINYDIESYQQMYEDSKTDKKFLLVCNHQSFLDPVMLLVHAKRPITFVSKKEYINMKFIGKILKAIDGKFLDRSNLKSEAVTILEVINTIKSQKCDVVIFPEGTRNKKPFEGILDFYPGTFKVALKAQCDIKVCSIFGGFRILDLKVKHAKQLFLQLNCIKDFKFEEFAQMNTVEIMNIAHEAIKNSVSEMIKKDSEYAESLVS